MNRFIYIKASIQGADAVFIWRAHLPLASFSINILASSKTKSVDKETKSEQLEKGVLVVIKREEP